MKTASPKAIFLATSRDLTPSHRHKELHEYESGGLTNNSDDVCATSSGRDLPWWP